MIGRIRIDWAGLAIKPVRRITINIQIGSGKHLKTAQRKIIVHFKTILTYVAVKRNKTCVGIIGIVRIDFPGKIRTEIRTALLRLTHQSSIPINSVNVLFTLPIASPIIAGRFYVVGIEINQIKTGAPTVADVVNILTIKLIVLLYRTPIVRTDFDGNNTNCFI